ncbi:putative protein kinase RLK-Pelle-DLSV family [Helianthus annuus]|uniref:non-specific serine/threonine protein kinase n=1 Tax=Helianthus annuus TaxID=4232 RepID=A0A9K3N605_HELAN|nr:putative protein kinase RLK-Pelle-DLSV family [Helianthus annuus]
MCNLLDWNKRYKIILGVAKVLLYLHRHAPIRIIHGDIKSANILLDESFDLKLSGFGLATTVNEADCIHVDMLRGSIVGMVARRNWWEGTLSNIIDPRIDIDSFFMTKFVKIGLLCVQENATFRPTMEEVVDMLLGTSSPALYKGQRAAIFGSRFEFDKH